jgi:uncharacterized protein with HEPN domain
VKDERIYLGHIREAIGDIRAYASVGKDAFLADRMRQDAIISGSSKSSVKRSSAS